MPAPVETETSLAPGAAPWSFSPEARVVGRPATIPFTWVPWPPTDRVSVSTKLGTFWTRAQALGRVAQRLQVGDDRAAAAALLEVGVGRVDTGVDHRDRDALAGELAAVGPGDGLGRLVAAGRLVGGVLEEADRLRAGLDVRHAGLAAHRLDLALGAASADDADLAERRRSSSGRRPSPRGWRRRGSRRARGRWSCRVSELSCLLRYGERSAWPGAALADIGAARPNARTAAAPAARDVGMRSRTLVSP